MLWAPEDINVFQFLKKICKLIHIKDNFRTPHQNLKKLKNKINVDFHNFLSFFFYFGGFWDTDNINGFLYLKKKKKRSICKIVYIKSNICTL